jgi:RecA/RadA recombinase
MNGGLHTGYITHVYGKAASGKTTLALQFVASAVHLELDTIYINTETASPVERLEQITERGYGDIESQVKILTPRSFEDQGVLIDDIELYARENTRVVIIDTLTRHYRLAMNESKKINFANHRELNRQTGVLKGLARNRDIAVLLLNQVTARPKGDEEFEPVARNILSYWSDVTVRTQIGRNQGSRMIIRLKPEGEPSQAQLYLCNDGFAMTPSTLEKE